MKPYRVVPIAISTNQNRPDFRGLPHESIEEAIKRGVKVCKIPRASFPIHSLSAVPKNKMTECGQTIYDWRV